MRTLFLIILSFLSLVARSQVICGTANENGTLTLTAPGGNIFTSIEFASYGTPTGACGAFTTSGCHAANSMSIVSAILLNQNSASIAATNGVFGDPCVGTVKRLYVRARYNATLPLTLVNFTARVIRNIVNLEWSTKDEHNTSKFEIERSTDGLLFESIGMIAANGEGNHQYHFTTKTSPLTTRTFFRLKMIDKDLKYSYSKTVTLAPVASYNTLTVLQNSGSSEIQVYSPVNQEAIVVNIAGQLLFRIRLSTGLQQLNTATLRNGLYVIKTNTEAVKFLKTR